MNENLPSKKQKELLSFIDGFIQGNGYGPSYREIMRALDYKSVSTVAVHVDGLITKGYLIKRDHSARSLEVVDGGKRVEKQATPEHEKWLVDKVSETIDILSQDPTPKNKHDAEVLIKTLNILQFDSAHTIMKRRLAEFAKQLDQTAQ